ncbi:MAG TPA: amidohydrolase family protein [Casimicrobiaceae bacterium]|nr:amidohydrolase family protein [Casimicrobiaceae bacterium]
MSAPGSSLPRVDAHHHVWQLARGDYGWLTPALAAIYRDFSLDDLHPLLERIRIGTTVLVQAAPTVAETEFLLEVAHGSGGLVRGVVGWVDLAAPAGASTLERLARDPLLKSIRPMLQDIGDPEWILRRDVDAQLGVIEQLGLRFDALVKPPQLSALMQMVERHPNLPVVIDHGGKPAIGDRDWEPWASEIAGLADYPTVVCKLSGLVTEAGSGWSPHALSAYVDHLLETLGPQRLLWGSDWPVVNLAGGYHRWARASDQLLARLPEADRNAIYGDNARRFYGL